MAKWISGSALAAVILATSLTASIAFAVDGPVCKKILEEAAAVDRVHEFNSGKLKAIGYFVENGVPGDVGKSFLDAGGPAGARSGASNSVIGAYVPYAKELRDAEVGAAPGGRYVSRASLEQQITYGVNKIAKVDFSGRPAGTRTFVYSNTVTTMHGNGLGWEGLDFHLQPGGEANKIRMHVRLTESKTDAQRAVIKATGFNMIHASYTELSKLETETDPAKRRDIVMTFLSELGRDVKKDSVEIDHLELDGPLFKDIDQRLLAYGLVKNGLTKHMLISPEGKIVPAFEGLYGKAVTAYKATDVPATSEIERVAGIVKTEAAGADVAVLQTYDLSGAASAANFDASVFAKAGGSGHWTLITTDSDPAALGTFLQDQRIGATGLVRGPSGAKLPSAVEDLPDPTGRRKTPVRVYNPPHETNGTFNDRVPFSIKPAEIRAA